MGCVFGILPYWLITIIFSGEVGGALALIVAFHAGLIGVVVEIGLDEWNSYINIDPPDIIKTFFIGLCLDSNL